MRSLLTVTCLLCGSGCRSSPDLTATQSATFDSHGVSIRYLSAGEGEPVVLLHGWMGEACHWGPGTRETPKLSPARGYRVIALDLRGHGKSGKPHDVAAYGEEMAADVIRLLDHLKLQKAHLVGYSMGSFVAGKVVEMAPARVASVVYGGGSPVLRTRASKGFGDADAFAKAVDSGKALGSYLIAVTPSNQPVPTLAQATSIAEKLFAHQDVKALAAVGKSFGRLEVDPKKLAANPLPSLLLFGEQESPWVRARVKESEAAVPGVKVTVIPGTNHMTTLIAPAFGTAIVEFIGAHPIRR